MKSQSPLVLQRCVAGCLWLEGPILLDDQFLHLVDKKIRARPASAMETATTKPTLRKLFGSLWEKKIKPRFDGTNDFHQTVPVELMTAVELQERRDQPSNADPTIKFTVYVTYTAYFFSIRKLTPFYTDSEVASLTSRQTRTQQAF